jgi:hypothetical protein
MELNTFHVILYIRHFLWNGIDDVIYDIQCSISYHICHQYQHQQHYQHVILY